MGSKSMNSPELPSSLSPNPLDHSLAGETSRDRLCHRGWVIAGVSLLLFTVAQQQAPAWQAQTTIAGVTEQAALGSSLHQRLDEQLGLTEGLFSILRIPPQDAPSLFELLKKLNPSNGHVPDPTGHQTALGWLAAGSALADTPPQQAVNHFYDPRTGKGASPAKGNLATTLRNRIASIVVRESLLRGGLAAPDWIISPENPMNVSGFHDQYRKAIKARTLGERNRHAAGALLAAGAIMSVLADMGSPAHVRDDLGSFFELFSGDQTDVGSRFERVAELAFGRLGIEPPAQVIKKSTLRDYFTAADKTGLADIVSIGYFSANTLPRPIPVAAKSTSTSISAALSKALRRPAPVPVGPFDLEAARSPVGGRLESSSGVCLAHFHLRDRRQGRAQLWFSIPDSCAVEQQRELLSLTTSYVAGALAYLFRGSLAVKLDGQMLTVSSDATALGSGTLTAFSDDELGVRSPFASVALTQPTAQKAVLASLAAPPQKTKRIAVLFEGVDTQGEPISAATTIKWPLDQ